MNKEKKDQSGRLYPMIYLYNRYLFPRCSIDIPARYASDKMLHQGEKIVLYTVTHMFNLLFPAGRIATLAEVVSIKDSKGIQMAEVRGEKRGIIRKRIRFQSARVSETNLAEADNSDDLVEMLRKKSQEFVFLINIQESDRLIYLMNFIQGIDDITDFISHYFIIDEKKKRVLYRETDPKKRGAILERYLDGMIANLRKNSGRG
jgi:hypothetical protein